MYICLCIICRSDNIDRKMSCVVVIIIIIYNNILFVLIESADKLNIMLYMFCIHIWFCIVKKKLGKI